MLRARSIRRTFREPMQVLVPIHRAGWPFIAIFLVVAVALGFLWQPLFWIGLLASAWCVYFFRDPPRKTPVRSGLVVAPADGSSRISSALTRARSTRSRRTATLARADSKRVCR